MNIKQMSRLKLSGNDIAIFTQMIKLESLYQRHNMSKLYCFKSQNMNMQIVYL